MTSVFKRFRNDQRGGSIIEFALLVPVLLAVLLGTVTLFDLFRNLQSVDKATFTVGDMMSRQSAMDRPMLNAMLIMLQQMVPSASDGGIRVSSVTRKSTGLEVVWTESVGGAIPTTPVSTASLPDIAEGDSVLLTESFVPHRAFVEMFGLDQLIFNAQAAHRPRFVSAMAFRR
jgi:Flp pilus assembly protein TadG